MNKPKVIDFEKAKKEKAEAEKKELKKRLIDKICKSAEKLGW